MGASCRDPRGPVATVWVLAVEIRGCQSLLYMGASCRDPWVPVATT